MPDQTQTRHAGSTQPPPSPARTQVRLQGQVASPVAPVAPIVGPTPDQEAAAREAEARLQQLLDMGDVSQANAATGIVGDSGTGKSTLAATAVEYCYNRYHKLSRYIAADPGGFGNKLIRLVRLGICEVYNPTNHIEPFETMEDLSLGYWPEKIDDPFTGYAAPDVKLIPPQMTKWVVYCPLGHEVKVVTARRSLEGFSTQCPTCKQAPVTPANWGRVEEITVRAPMIEHVGLYVFDSGTSLSDWAMEDMANRAAKNDPGIQDGNALSKTGARIVSGARSFGANTIQHYGFAQNRMRAWIKNARTIPGQVVPPIFTFLELRATDDAKNIAIYGPKIAGNAKTADVPSWLGNCLHTTKERNDKGIEEHRLYLVNHTDIGGNIPHLAKTRAEPGTLPPYLADGPDDQPFTKYSLAYFFDQLEQALDVASQRDAVDYPDAPAFKPLQVATQDVIVSRKDLSGPQTGIRTGARPGTATAAARQSAQPPVSARTSQGTGAKAGGVPAAAVAATAPAPAPAASPAAPRPTATAQPAAAPPAATGPRPAPRPVQAPAPVTARPTPAPVAPAPGQVKVAAPVPVAAAPQPTQAPLPVAPVVASAPPQAPPGKPPTPSAVRTLAPPGKRPPTT